MLSEVILSDEERTADYAASVPGVENVPEAEAGQEDATPAATCEVFEKVAETCLCSEEKETLAGSGVVLEPQAEDGLEDGLSLLEKETSVGLEELRETDLNVEKRSVSMEVEEGLEIKKKVSTKEAWMEQDLISFDDETEELFQSAAEPSQVAIETAGDVEVEKTTKDTEAEKEGEKKGQEQEKKPEVLAEMEQILTADDLHSGVTSDGSVDKVTDQPTLDVISPSEDQPTLDAISPAEDQPTLDAISPAEDQPTLDAISPAEDQPTLDALSPGEDQPTLDTISAAEDQPTLDAISPSEDQPTLDAISPSEDQPTLDAISPAEDQPTLDAISPAEDQPTLDALSPGEDQPTLDTISAAEDQPTLDAISPSEDQPTLDALSPGEDQPTVD